MFVSEYLASLIFKYFTESSSLSDLSSFLLVQIAFAFYLCVLDAWLNISAVMLLSSAIDSSSMTLRIASQIFSLDNGVFLC